jgi:hypothetical protein
MIMGDSVIQQSDRVYHKTFVPNLTGPPRTELSVHIPDTVYPLLILVYVAVGNGAATDLGIVRRSEHGVVDVERGAYHLCSEGVIAFCWSGLA